MKRAKGFFAQIRSVQSLPSYNITTEKSRMILQEITRESMKCLEPLHVRKKTLSPYEETRKEKSTATMQCHSITRFLRIFLVFYTNFAGILSILPQLSRIESSEI